MVLKLLEVNESRKSIKLNVTYTGCPENRDKYFGTWFGTSKEGKKTYKYRSGNKLFPSYSHFYVNKNVFYIPRCIAFKIFY